MYPILVKFELSLPFKGTLMQILYMFMFKYYIPVNIAKSLFTNIQKTIECVKNYANF